MQRGPAYTEMALFAQLNEDGTLELKNHLGIDLGDTPEEILENLQAQRYQRKDIQQACGKGHDHAYCNHVRQIDEDSLPVLMPILPATTRLPVVQES